MNWKSDQTRFLLCLLFFAVLAAIIFRSTWGEGMVFAGSDMSIGRLATIKNSLPESFSGVYHTGPVLGSSGYSVNLFKVLCALFPLVPFANGFYAGMLVLGSLSLVWFLRIWGRSWAAALFGALVAFWFNSIMLAAGGHVYKVEVLVFSALSLALIEKAIRAITVKGTLGYSIFAGLAVGVMLLEQQDVALLAGLFVGPYAIFRLIQVHGKSISRWGAVLAPIAVVGLVLSGIMVFKSYERNIAGAAAVQGGGDAKWNYVTQWSMVPSEWPDLIAMGWSGWGSNDPEGPYWGKVGQSAEWEETQQGFRNFKITSTYLGIIPFLAGLLGLTYAVRNRKEMEARTVLFWGIAGLLGLGLACGKYSLLYKLFFQLPLVNNIRAPIKFLDNFQICLGIIGAYGLDQLLHANRGEKIARVFWMVAAVIGVLSLGAGLRYLVAPSGQMDVFKEMGFGNYAAIMVRNMSSAWFHAALLALVFAGTVFALWKGAGHTQWLGVLLVLVLAIDSAVLTSHYFRSTSITALKNGNVVTTYLKQNQGAERAYFVDQSGIYNQWLASDVPFHELNVFNFWQMPRMPVVYKNFLATLGRNPVRMWELAAVKYIAAPAGVTQQLEQDPRMKGKFVPVLNYQVPTSKGPRQDVILEYTDTIPRFAFYSSWDAKPLEEHLNLMADPRRDIKTTLLVDAEMGLSSQAGAARFIPLRGSVEKRGAVVEVEAKQPGIVRFAQRFQDNIKVLVDGEPAELLRVDYLCMGVKLPAGSHRVEFKPANGKGNAVLMAAILLASLVSGTLLIRLGKRDTA